MFYRTIDKDIKIRLSVPQFAKALFELTDQNRRYLRAWLPWLDTIRQPCDTRAFIERQLLMFAKGEALHQTIFYRGAAAGVLGFNRIDRENNIGHIGYWLGEAFTGRGIMTRSVSDLIFLGTEYFGLQRMEIRCARENKKSRAIPERLKFKNEGVIRRAEKVYDSYNDHVVYGRLTE